MKKHKNVGIKEDTYKKLIFFSKRSGVSMTNLTSQAVDYYIDNNILQKVIQELDNE